MGDVLFLMCCSYPFILPAGSKGMRWECFKSVKLISLTNLGWVFFRAAMNGDSICDGPERKCRGVDGMTALTDVGT